MRPIPLLYVLLALSLGAPLGCGGRADEPAPHADQGKNDEGHGHEDTHPETALHLNADELARLGLTLAVTGSGSIDQGVELLGEVHPNGDRLAHITPRFPGIVRDVRRAVGDIVKAGDILAVIESSESLAPYELKTLLDGTIIEKHLTRGEAVDREKPCFVIADLSTVWVDFSIYQKDLDRIRLGQTVRVRAGQDGPEAEGVVSYLTPGVDRATRTATARVVLPNRDGRWRPGMFVTALALEPSLAVLTIPSSAIQTLEGRPTAFVVAGDEVHPRPLTLGRRGDTTTEILSGLKAGDQVVATNSFLLKAELGKSEAEHEH